MLRHAMVLALGLVVLPGTSACAQQEEITAELIRKFAAEAFVIPTGAMAPTLLGRHKAFDCPKCGHRYRVNASGEVDSAGQSRGPRFRVIGGTCPMCRYSISPGAAAAKPKIFEWTGRDRILVGKASYKLAEPERWDVAVFKYPGDVRVNYVKRIVGLPHETIRISLGDLFVKAEGKDQFAIARRPPATVKALLQIVFDNDYAPKIIEQGWPARWTARRGPEDAAGRWVASKDHLSFTTGGKTDEEVRLRYEHRVPSPQDWRQMALGSWPEDATLQPQLVSDFLAYNTSRTQMFADADREPPPEGLGLHWVGDLAVQCTLELKGKTGQAVLELVEGGRRMRCRFDVATGEARLSIDGLDSFGPKATTAVRGPGTYEILLANVDDQLLLWVDKKLVRFDVATTYHPLGNTRPKPADLAPAGVASRGAALRVSRLKLFRDNYYIAVGGPQHSPFPRVITDFKDFRFPHRVLSEPGLWAAFDRMNQVEFSLGADQFLMLGDNSARSKDSRLWAAEGVHHYVARKLLVGKVLWLYFPRAGIVR